MPPSPEKILLALLTLIAQAQNDSRCIAHAQVTLFYSAHAKYRLDLQSSLQIKALRLQSDRIWKQLYDYDSTAIYFTLCHDFAHF